MTDILADIFIYIFLNEKPLICTKISLNVVPKGPVNNMLALVLIMAWRRTGDKLLVQDWQIYIWYADNTICIAGRDFNLCKL